MKVFILGLFSQLREEGGARLPYYRVQSLKICLFGERERESVCICTLCMATVYCLPLHCHYVIWKRPIKVWNLKHISLFFFLFFFALACERTCIKTHSTKNRCHRNGKYTVCRCVRASFSPVILHAGAVKGLSFNQPQKVTERSSSGLSKEAHAKPPKILLHTHECRHQTFYCMITAGQLYGRIRTKHKIFLWSTSPYCSRSRHTQNMHT